MKIENVHDIVKKLVGPIEPVGESHTDGRRFDNLVQMTDLVGWLMNDIYHVSHDADSHMHSVSKAGKHAKLFLKSMGDYTPDAEN